MNRMRTALVLAALMGSASLSVPGALAQETDIPSVSVQPADPTGLGPNGGEWFVYEIEPGEGAAGRAVVYNPAEVAQTVHFAIADLAFNAGGSPDVVAGEQIDVGSWGTVAVDEAVIPSKATLAIDFTLAVPEDAEPGDHIGVFMATTVNQQGLFAVERRIAKRLYVTVPGDVTAAWEIERVELEDTSGFIPSSAQLLVQLRNTGRVRVEPTVLAGDVVAEGSPILLAKSAEQYHHQVDVPWWGGPVNVPVKVTTADGSVQVANASLFIIPTGPIILLVAAALLVLGVRAWMKRRVGRTAALQQDIDRLERMLRESQGAGGVVPAPDGASTLGSADAQDDSPAEEDHRAVLMQAAKRARRAGDHAGLTKVALKLHEHDRDALELLLETAVITSGDSTELLAAASSYGASALASGIVDQLRPEQRNLLERMVAEALLGMHSSVASHQVGNPTPGLWADAQHLAQIPGLGAAKQQALLEHFGSVDAIAGASADDLTAVRGIGPSLAAKVAEHFAGAST